MIRKLIALVALCSSVIVFAATPRAEAAELRSAGWWSRTATTNPLAESPQAPPVPLTTPETVPNPSVPQGQLMVEGNVDGALAIAAIHWRLHDAESSPSLVLPVGPGSTVTSESVILACRAAVEWTPPETRPGRWETKPVTDGRACINGVIADDGSSVGFGLQPLVNGRDLDITLVPGTIAGAPEQLDGSVFRWVFEDPADDALAVVESGFTKGADPVVVTSPPTTAAPAPVAAPATATPRATTVPAMASTVPVSVAGPTGDSSEIAGPALEPTDLGVTVARAPIASIAAPQGASRLVGVVLFALGLAAMAWSRFSPESPELAMVGLGRFRRPMPGYEAPPAPTGLAARFAPAATAARGPVTGGLSRFARERREPPVPIN